MKIAVSGKGGSGKTTVSGTLARLFASEGYDVLAIDDDVNPNLALTVGIQGNHKVGPIPRDHRYIQTPKGETKLELAKTPKEIINDYGTTGPDGVAVLMVGEVEQADSGGMCRVHSIARGVLSGIVEDHEEVTVMDMEAGVEHLKRGTAKEVDVLLVVVEPYYKSLVTGRHTQELAVNLGISNVRVIANKVRHEHDLEAIEEFCTNHDLEIAAVIPYDDTIREADQEEMAPVDYDSDAPAVHAIRELADDLINTHSREQDRADSVKR